MTRITLTAERAKTAAAIKHFEALQKRYTAQHNGTACEYVRLALEGLRRMEQEPEVVRAYWRVVPVNGYGGSRLVCSNCGEETLFQHKFCPECGRPMDGQRAGEGQHGTD